MNKNAANVHELMLWQFIVDSKLIYTEDFESVDVRGP